MARLDMFVGEAYTATITFGDNLVAATLAFDVAESPGAVPIIRKVHSDFDITQAAAGIVRFTFTASDTGQPGLYVGQFKAFYSPSKIIKPDLVSVQIKAAVI